MFDWCEKGEREKVESYKFRSTPSIGLAFDRMKFVLLLVVVFAHAEAAPQLFAKPKCK